ncbi:TonB-dependent receptor [Vreelandella titanicae]|nr:TonB-dependent receptor [Halomonas titanicae]NVE90751.1 TonB-dependent receptor [Halomonas titanicae]|tara:strand:- start:334 stop:2337 length:2004 start_codon:yes stop_codon:yes gene_type:complete
MQSKGLKRKAVVVLLLGGCGVGSIAQGEALPVVKVTANKVAQTEQEVPASLAVISGETLVNAGASNIGDLARYAPGLSFQPFGQSGTALPVMRGLTSGATAFSSSVLMLVDGVPVVAGQGFDHNLQGVERVEVLRGPQSTLYGRNAEAGVVSLHTRQPDAGPYAELATTLGSRDLNALRLDAAQALVPEQLYLGGSGEWRQQDGFVDNLARAGEADDRERKNGRLRLLWMPTAETNVTLRYGQLHYRDGAAPWGPVGSNGHDTRRIDSPSPGSNRSSGRDISLDVRHALAPDLTLRSITARREIRDRVTQDTDLTPAQRFAVGRDQRLTTLSQELRLERQGDEGRSSWVLGLYGDRDDHQLQFEQRNPMGTQRNEATLEAENLALFGQWTLPLGERWRLTPGLRIEQSRVALTPRGAGQRSERWDDVTSQLALQYRLGDDDWLYARYAEGFRAGGFNAFSAQSDYPGYEPEQVASYELGIKGTALSQRLRYGLASYWMTIDDMQVQQVIQPGSVQITNAAAARSQGIELDIDYLLGGHWTLQAGLALNRTRFREFNDLSGDHAGNHNPFAPDISGRLGLRYDSPQGWYAQANLSGMSKTYLDAANRFSRPGHALLDLAGGYQQGPWQLGVYVNNAADRQYDAVGLLNGTIREYSPPREIGLRVGVSL